MTDTTTPSKKTDWIWNALTIACLVISSSFVTNTLHAFSQDGFDLLQTFGAISQGAGLLLITGGTLTYKGKQVIKDILATFKVSPNYQAFGTFLIALAVLIITFLINLSLPLLGNYYYQRGDDYYQEGRLSSAQTSFQQALNFVKKESKLNEDINLSLGNIYESLGDHSKAKPLYQVGASGGNPASLNGLGRVQMRTASNFQDLLMAETSFRIGLEQPAQDPTLQAEMLAHLGMVLIKQAEANKDRATALQNEAKAILQQGIALDKTLKERAPGYGMSYCYLAILQKKLSQPPQWQNCIAHALPTSVDQFRDIVFYAEPGIAAKINTAGIVQATLEE